MWVSQLSFCLPFYKCNATYFCLGWVLFLDFCSCSFFWLPLTTAHTQHLDSCKTCLHVAWLPFLVQESPGNAPTCCPICSIFLLSNHSSRQQGDTYQIRVVFSPMPNLVTSKAQLVDALIANGLFSSSKDNQGGQRFLNVNLNAKPCISSFGFSRRMRVDL